jgi:hypothetical protein
MMELLGKIARKTGDPRLLSLECLKSERAAALGDASGLFYVPRVIRFDPSQGLLETEQIPELKGLLSIILERRPCKSMFESAGRALAVIHSRLELPDEWKLPLPPPFATASQGVFLHGDFNVANVCYDFEQSRLVIIDWSAAPDFGGNFSFGSRYFDLAWFAFCLFCSVPVHRLLDWDDALLAKALISGYAAEIGHFDWSGFKQYAQVLSPVLRNVQRGKIRRGHQLKRPAYAVLQSLVWFRWQRFLRGGRVQAQRSAFVSTGEAASA